MCQRGGYLLVCTSRPHPAVPVPEWCRVRELTAAGGVDPDAADVAWRGASRERCAVYRFNTRRKQQLFCPRCGVGLGIDYSGVPGRTDYGISVGCPPSPFSLCFS